MANPHPSNGFKKGRKKPANSGRKAGTLNHNTQDLKDALLNAADALGYPKEVVVLDKQGKPTGEIKLKKTGKGGTQGFLEWLGLNRPVAFASLLGRVFPYQVNVKTDTKVTVNYGTIEEKRAALIERGIDPEALERAMQPKFLIEHQKEQAAE